MPVLLPADESEAVAMVADAVRAPEPRTSFAIRGHGTRAALHPAPGASAVLDLSRLAGITLYEPAELVLAVRAATPLTEVRALLAGRGQQLAFDPPDFGPLWGRPAGQGTMGGAIAVGLGGPRRPRAGAPRDHLLGVRGISGQGECFVSGGRVVKNVTGFDLCKLLTGSYGALGVLTELTLKVMPCPTARQSVIIAGKDETAGLATLRAALAEARPLTAGAYLPAGLAARVLPGLAATESATVLAVEGVPPAVESAIGALVHAHPGRCTRLATEDSVALWAAIGGAAFFAAGPGAVLRISLPPARAPAVAAALRGLGVRDLYHDWFGGLLVLRAGHEAAAPALLRAAVARVEPDSHVAVIRGEGGGEGGGDVSPFHSPSPGVARLSRRLKDRLDPLGLFNPGCLPGAT